MNNAQMLSYIESLINHLESYAPSTDAEREITDACVLLKHSCAKLEQAIEDEHVRRMSELRSFGI